MVENELDKEAATKQYKRPHHKGGHRHHHHASADPGHHRHRRHEHHKKTSTNESPRTVSASPGMVGDTPEAIVDEMNKTPVTLETIDDCESPVPPYSYLQAQDNSPPSKSDILAVTAIPSTHLKAQNDHAVVMNDQAIGKEKELVKSSFWRSFAKRVNNRNRQVTHASNHEAVNSDQISGDNIDSMHSQDTNSCTIPVATLVEEDERCNASVKWKLFAIILIIIIIGIVVGVTASSASRDGIDSAAQGTSNTRGNMISPDQIPIMHNYTVWFRPNEFGGRANYYGATCNALGFACTACGVYEVQIDRNEVIGSCNNCNICSDGKGFEADCTNLGSGTFNCNYLNEAQPIPEGYNYTLWYCPYERGDRAVCMAYGDCNLLGTECTKCGVFELQRDTTEVIGVCSSCSVCAGGGVSADCTNIGHGTFNCYYPENE